MQDEKQASASSNEDVSIINRLELDQIWLYALALAVPPGTRIVPQELVMKRLGISPEDAQSISSIFFGSVNTIANRALAPASTLRTLSGIGLEIERATLLTDLATVYAQTAPDPLRDIIAPLTQRLDSLESALKEITKK